MKEEESVIQDFKFVVLEDMIDVENALMFNIIWMKQLQTLKFFSEKKLKAAVKMNRQVQYFYKELTACILLL